MLPTRLGAAGALFLLALSACSAHHASHGSSSESGDRSSESLSDLRDSCHFGAGATVKDTLGIDAKTRAAIPIKTIVVVMKENRSFDQLFGHLHDTVQPDSDPIPATFTNPDLTGAPVAPFPLATTCVPQDPAHQWDNMHAQIDDGKMDGFVTSAAHSTGTDGHFVMGTYTQADLPFYYWLAGTYALSDHHFASEQSGTYPNRLFMLLGTADGITSTGLGYPDPRTKTLFDSLDAAHVDWGVYSDGSLLGGALPWSRTHHGVHSFASFLTALDDGSLPPVVFVDGVPNVDDEHPKGDVQVGEAWTRQVYEHAINSPLWPGMTMIWTYDEAGGFVDHVPPPTHACVARSVPKDQKFHAPGARVPLTMISPWSRPHYVSHVVHEHTAITRFVETVFDLPALTARDANSPGLLDLLDFTNPALLTPPAAPASGTGGCPSGSSH